jgi:long-chain acyl-CoA synthetase
MQTPDRPAIIMGATGEYVTFRELDERSRAIAQALRARGLSEGSHIAVMMQNNRAYLEVTWAAQRSGLYYTAINSHLRASEVQYVLDDCGATALVSSEAMHEVVAQLDLSRVPTRIAVDGGLPGFEGYDDLLTSSAASLVDEREGREMLYSSGTTGHPKGVRKPLPEAAFGEPSAAPVLMAQAMAAYASAPTPCICPPRRSTTRRRSSTR